MKLRHRSWHEVLLWKSKRRGREEVGPGSPLEGYMQQKLAQTTVCLANEGCKLCLVVWRVCQTPHEHSLVRLDKSSQFLYMTRQENHCRWKNWQTCYH